VIRAKYRRDERSGDFSRTSFLVTVISQSP
jgi:hypothetical protein